MNYIQAEKTIRKMLQSGVVHTCDGTPLSQSEIDALNKALKTLHKVGSKEESKKKRKWRI